MAGRHRIIIMNNVHRHLDNFQYVGCSDTRAMATEEAAIELLTDLALVPSRTATAPPCCGRPMRVANVRTARLGWVWRCGRRRPAAISSTTLAAERQDAGNSSTGAVATTTLMASAGGCHKQISPTAGTLLEAARCRSSVREVLLIVFCFVYQMSHDHCTSEVKVSRSVHNWHGRDCAQTVINYYLCLLHVCAVVASHGDFADGTDVPMGNRDNLGPQIQQMLVYCRRCYPGYVDGELARPLRFRTVSWFVKPKHPPRLSGWLRWQRYLHIVSLELAFEAEDVEAPRGAGDGAETDEVEEEEEEQQHEEKVEAKAMAGIEAPVKVECEDAVEVMNTGLPNPSTSNVKLVKMEPVIKMDPVPIVNVPPKFEVSAQATRRTSLRLSCKLAPRVSKMAKATATEEEEEEESDDNELDDSVEMEWTPSQE